MNQIFLHERHVSWLNSFPGYQIYFEIEHILKFMRQSDIIKTIYSCIKIHEYIYIAFFIKIPTGVRAK